MTPEVPSPAAGGTVPPAAVEFRYSQTEGFVALLREHGASLLVSTDQANKLSGRPPAMDEVPLAARRESLKCDVAAVDLRDGRVAGLLEFEMAVEEVFDVRLLDGARFPEVLGFQRDAVSNTFVVPPPGAAVSKQPVPALPRWRMAADLCSLAVRRSANSSRNAHASVGGHRSGERVDDGPRPEDGTLGQQEHVAGADRS